MLEKQEQLDKLNKIAQLESEIEKKIKSSPLEKAVTQPQQDIGTVSVAPEKVSKGSDGVKATAVSETTETLSEQPSVPSEEVIFHKLQDKYNALKGQLDSLTKASQGMAVTEETQQKETQTDIPSIPSSVQSETKTDDVTLVKAAQPSSVEVASKPITTENEAQSNQKISASD
eukprot:c4493_g1_i1.p3 GENE.c4493_g1_i1~~c4493_g1_i1.p3  ORF type:complete len:173 (+),score=58.77 c4493_g1_i1:1492-2010(+)